MSEFKRWITPKPKLPFETELDLMSANEALNSSDPEASYFSYSERTERLAIGLFVELKSYLDEYFSPVSTKRASITERERWGKLLLIGIKFDEYQSLHDSFRKPQTHPFDPERVMGRFGSIATIQIGTDKVKGLAKGFLTFSSELGRHDPFQPLRNLSHGLV